MSIDSKQVEPRGAGVPAVNGLAAGKAKRVLVVSYDFPPNPSRAVYRMTGLTKHLCDFGGAPTVLTIRAGENTQEPKLLEKLPADVEVIRTPFLRINGWENRIANTIAGADGLQPAATAHRERRFARQTRFLAELLRSTLYFPDDTVGWVPFALSRAIELHQRNPFDAVFATSPPRSAPVIGLLMKLFYGVPFVFELMDPWYPVKGRFRSKSDEWLQALLLRKADRVVVMVPQHAEELSRDFHVPAEKIAVVRNGFFEEDFASAEMAKQPPLDPRYFHLSHFGTIYPDNYGSFFSALIELLRDSPGLRGWLRVNIFGYPCESVLRYAADGELKDIMQVRGFLEDRADILQMMRASDCLLLFWGREDFSKLAVAGKTYDYLRIGRPILALAHEGGVRELVEGAVAGWAVAPQDKEGIKQALRMAIEGQRTNEAPRPPRPEFVAQFRWECLTETLAGVLQGAVDNAR